MDLSEFPEIAELSSGQSYSVVLPIDFGDTTQTAHFELAVGDLKHNCSIQAPVGEQLQPLKMSPLMFAQIQSLNFQKSIPFISFNLFSIFNKQKNSAV